MGLEKKSERAVSRVLCPRLPGAVSIYLGRRLPDSTSDLPGSLGRAVLTPDYSGGASLCDLAPGGVFQALPVARKSGGLLPHRFTLALAGGLLFCGTVHGVAPCPVSGPPCPAELGLSSPRCRGAITSPALITVNPYGDGATNGHESPQNLFFIHSRPLLQLRGELPPLFVDSSCAKGICLFVSLTHYIVYLYTADLFNQFPGPGRERLPPGSSAARRRCKWPVPP